MQSEKEDYYYIFINACFLLNSSQNKFLIFHFRNFFFHFVAFLMIDLKKNFLTACQTIWGYFMPKGLEIVLIVHLYLHLFI